MYTKEEISLANEEFNRSRAEAEQTLRRRLSCVFSDDNARDTAMAMTEFLNFVTEGDTLAWLAGLYDGERGGFYFSNSARDNDGYLPDLESTRQAISFFNSSRAMSYIAPTYIEAFPSWMRDDVVYFVKSMQDPYDGYFYHPQWDKIEASRSLGRVGRDLNWATMLLDYFGKKPTYDTPAGVLGDGIRYDGAKVDPHIRPSCATSDRPKTKPHLECRESFTALLSELEPCLYEKSWEIGNRFESEGLEILNRDRQLEGKGGLVEILDSWFAQHQNPKTGAWTAGDEISYDTTNGLLKICSTYNKINRRFPNPTAALSSAIKSIVSDEVPHTVCHVLNPWYAVNVITMNVKRFSTNEYEIKETERANRYVAENCAEMIAATQKKLARFKIGDGSFIYTPNRVGKSQGMRVAPDGVWDGDVNATTICVRAIAEHIYDILDARMPPLFSKGEAMNFMNIIESKRRDKG